MNYKQKMVVMLLLWGMMMLMGKGLSLNEKPWFAILTIIISSTLVFGGKKIWNKIQNRKSS